MSEETIKAETRTEFGKGAARRIRREDKVPAVIYGHGNEPVHITLPGHETLLAIKHGGANALIDLDIEGTKQLALTKQVQVDPVRRTLEHIDFVAVKRGEKVQVEIPVHVVGEAASETLVVTDLATLQVEAEATHIPEFVEVDVADAEAGTQFHASDVALPKGSTLLTDADALVVNVTAAPTAEQLEAELEDAEAEAGIEKDAPEGEGEGDEAPAEESDSDSE